MGKFIVIEGMDGAGTTTQTKMLCDYLATQGLRTVASAEPTKSPIGQEIRAILKSASEPAQEILVSLALCFAADRMQHVHNTIAPSLKSHDLVVLDRYLMSSLVYQGLHLPTEYIETINRYAIKPDLTLVLDLDAKIASERLKARTNSKDFYEQVDVLERIRHRYLHFANINKSSCVVVNAADPVDQVHSHIIHVVHELMRDG